MRLEPTMPTINEIFEDSLVDIEKISTIQGLRSAKTGNPFHFINHGTMRKKRFSSEILMSDWMRDIRRNIYIHPDNNFKKGVKYSCDRTR